MSRFWMNCSLLSLDMTDFLLKAEKWILYPDFLQDIQWECNEGQLVHLTHHISSFNFKYFMQSLQTGISQKGSSYFIYSFCKKSPVPVFKCSYLINGIVITEIYIVWSSWYIFHSKKNLIAYFLIFFKKTFFLLNGKKLLSHWKRQLGNIGLW